MRGVCVCVAGGLGDGGVRENLPSLLVRPGLPSLLFLRVSPVVENERFTQIFYLTFKVPL